MTTAIPVFRGTHMLPFLDFCNQHGLPVDASLRRYRLPTDFSDAANIYLPQLASINAITDMSERSGLLDMPARVATATEFADYGEAICSTVRSSPAIVVAIRRLSALIKQEDSSLSIAVQSNRGITWLNAEESVGSTFACNDWSNIMLLVHTVRDFIGNDWQPSDIKLTSEPREFAIAQQYFPDSRLFWDPKLTGISLPTELLNVTRTNEFTRMFTAEDLAEEKPRGPDLLDTVTGLITAYLPMGGLSIELLAEMAGSSSRSLQRKLADRGLTFSELVDQTRFEKAAHLLTTTDAKALEIGLAVGYGDPSHFTRSFKRMTNMTPREYRRRHRIQ